MVTYNRENKQIEITEYIDAEFVDQELQRHLEDSGLANGKLDDADMDELMQEIVNAIQDAEYIDEALDTVEVVDRVIADFLTDYDLDKLK